jgi:ABC-type branched-subunit amino acid transport system ATPase component
MHILEVIGVSKQFGNVTALNDFSCTVREGEILGLIGPNGAGKTTLVNLISGGVPYSTGDIRFHGKSIRGLKAHQIGRLGISRTSPVAPPDSKMTALDNVMVGAFFGKKGRQKTERAALYFHKVRAERGQGHMKVEPLRFYLDLLRYPFMHRQAGRSKLLAILLLISQAVNTAGFCRDALSRPAKRSI